MLRRGYAQSLMERYGFAKLKNERATFAEMVDTLMLAIEKRAAAESFDGG